MLSCVNSLNNFMPCESLFHAMACVRCGGRICMCHVIWIGLLCARQLVAHNKVARCTGAVHRSRPAISRDQVAYVYDNLMRMSCCRVLKKMRLCRVRAKMGRSSSLPGNRCESLSNRMKGSLRFSRLCTPYAGNIFGGMV